MNITVAEGCHYHDTVRAWLYVPSCVVSIYSSCEIVLILIDLEEFYSHVPFYFQFWFIFFFSFLLNLWKIVKFWVAALGHHKPATSHSYETKSGNFIVNSGGGGRNYKIICFYHLSWFYPVYPSTFSPFANPACFGIRTNCAVFLKSGI